MDCPPQKKTQYDYNLKYTSRPEIRERRKKWTRNYRETHAQKFREYKLKERRKGFSGDIAFEEREIHITFD